MKNFVLLTACTLIMSASFAQTEPAKPIDNPIASVAGLFGGNISKKKLLKAENITTASKDSTVTYKIISFTLSVYRDKEHQWVLKSVTDLITTEMKDIISNCKQGDLLYFEYILCTGSNNTVQKLPSVNFVVH